MQEKLVPVSTGKEQGILAINDMIEEGIVINSVLMQDLANLV